jgi:hypothetical protein
MPEWSKEKQTASMIVSTYNHVPIINRAIKSILNQI